jgi:hypothetical protein
VRRDKHFCLSCGWAAKGPCPRQGHESVRMGTQWRPGRKGSRTRLWDDRVSGDSQPAPVELVRVARNVYRSVVRFPPGRKPDVTLTLTSHPGREYSGGRWPDPVLAAIRARHLHGKVSRRRK